MLLDQITGRLVRTVRVASFDYTQVSERAASDEGTGPKVLPPIQPQPLNFFARLLN